MISLHSSSSSSLLSFSDLLSPETTGRVVGHLHHLAGAPPHRALRDLARRHGPLMALRLCELPVVVASSPDAAREVMRTHDTEFASRPIGPTLRLAYHGAEGVIFAPYGDGWRRLRRICTAELLSARRVHSFRPVREDELAVLLRAAASAAAAGAPVSLGDRVAAFAADSTVRAVIGSRSEHRDEFLRVLQEGLKIIPGLSLSDLFPSLRLAMLVSRVPGRIERQAGSGEERRSERREKRREKGGRRRGAKSHFSG